VYEIAERLWLYIVALQSIALLCVVITLLVARVNHKVATFLFQDWDSVTDSVLYCTAFACGKRQDMLKLCEVRSVSTDSRARHMTRRPARRPIPIPGNCI
jgi:hypothetical protein